MYKSDLLYAYYFPFQWGTNTGKGDLKYGFKASFFVVCDYVNTAGVRRMNWQDIAELQKDGMDIESHTMTHVHLNGLEQDSRLKRLSC
jgi:hypothetical protein